MDRRLGLLDWRGFNPRDGWRIALALDLDVFFFISGPPYKDEHDNY